MSNPSLTERLEPLEKEKELAHWKTCSFCGQQMEAPGHCSDGETEQVAGLKSMHEQTLTRAEAAEAALRDLELYKEGAEDIAELLSVACDVTALLNAVTALLTLRESLSKLSEQWLAEADDERTSHDEKGAFRACASDLSACALLSRPPESRT